MTLVEVLRAASVPVWVVATFVMLPGTWRFLRGRPRSLDALWFGGMLLAINRVSFQVNSIWGPTGWMRAWCYASAVGAGIAWLLIARGYQRHDT